MALNENLPEEFFDRLDRFKQIDWVMFGREALNTAREPIGKLVLDSSQQAQELVKAGDDLLAAYATVADALARAANEHERQAFVSLLETTLPRRAQSLKAAVAAYGANDVANAVDAGLAVAIKIILLLVKTIFLG